ncbi:MAG: lamin tail domain-containing protein [Candidatus Hodarchaeales archaeon]|jgi:hypothetical protein
MKLQTRQLKSKMELVKAISIILFFIISAFSIISQTQFKKNESNILSSPLSFEKAESALNLLENNLNPFRDVYSDLESSENYPSPQKIQDIASYPEILTDYDNIWLDEFVSRNLNNRWNWTDTGSSYSLTSKPGWLTITHDNSDGKLKTKEKLPDDDWEVETFVKTGTTEDTSLGIIFDDLGVFPSIYGYMNFSTYNSNLGLWYLLNANEYGNLSSTEWSTGVHLRANYSASNDQLTFYYRLYNNITWVQAGQAALSSGEVNVGIYGICQDTNEVLVAEFDYFKVEVEKEFNLLQNLRDNVNDYQQVWTPWLTKAAVHTAAVSPDGEVLVVGGGFLLDTELHIYRWDYLQRKYVKAWEAGSGIIQGDVYDIAFGDSDNNRLQDIAAASADGRVHLFEQAHIYDPYANLESRFDHVWSSPKLGQQVSSVEFYDADLDLINDLIVGSWDKKIRIYEYVNHSGYPFASTDHWIDMMKKWESPELDSAVYSIASGDFNGNGLPEFIVGTLSGTVYVFENDGLVVNVRGTPQLLPNDNNYELVWNSSEVLQTIWNPVWKIEAADLDNSIGTDAVLLAWGQGAYVFRYSSTNGYYIEQLNKPYQFWETTDPYPLDNYADWIVFNKSRNVFMDTNNDGNYNFNESIVGSCCPINPSVNSPSGDQPDNKYSNYRPTSDQNASQIYEFGEGEKVAVSGNNQPDVYVLLNDINYYSVYPDRWSVAISNDQLKWYFVDSAQITKKLGSRVSIAIDLDPVFAENKITSITYLKLTLAEGSNQRFVDTIFYPYSSRSLTMASSITLQPLKVSANDDGGNRIVFGTVDGRFLAYKFESDTSKFDYLDKTGSSLISTYGVNIPDFDEIWDSYENDNYNVNTTIWSIYGTPKSSIIPSWRYNEGDVNTPEFDETTDFINNWGTGDPNTRVHMFNVVDLHWPGWLPAPEIIVSTNNSDDDATKKLLVYDSVTGEPQTFFGSIDSTDFFFANVNNFYNISPINELLTHAFGDIDQSTGTAGPELLTLPWYQDNRTKHTGGSVDISEVYPHLWSSSNYGTFISYGSLDTYFASSQDIETNLTAFENFYEASKTFPSAAIVDLNHDGLSDIVISNGLLAVLWNVGTKSTPSFIFDNSYFDEVNSDLVGPYIFAPQMWDYDHDGDYDIAFSYGKGSDDPIWGFDFFMNLGPNVRDEIAWQRNIQIVENPSVHGSLISNHYNLGVIIPSDSCAKADILSDCSSAEAFWVYSPDETGTLTPANLEGVSITFKERIRRLSAEVDVQSSFIVGTNPNIMKVEINRFPPHKFPPQPLPSSINMGYALTTSWTNADKQSEWTRTLATSDLDLDGNKEIIVGDFDNNIYVFEHMFNNTYKRAFKSHNLNHTRETSISPYLFEELAGIPGEFSEIEFDHTNFLISGVDFNNDGKPGFVATSGLTIYVFESTGYNDETAFFTKFDIGEIFDGHYDFDPTIETEITAMAVTYDFDGRGSMIAVAVNNKLFLFRQDPVLGLIESFQFSEQGPGFYNLPGNPLYHPDLVIKTLLYADINKDGYTELWIGGLNKSSGLDGFLIALQADLAGNIRQVFDFPTSLTQNNEINALITSDADIDGNLELVIGHNLGIDLWEFTKDEILTASRLDVISSDINYATANGIDASLFNEIINVKSVAVGDSDADTRSELFVSHGQRVTLLEVYFDQDLGKVRHRQVWQSLLYDQNTKDLAIFDANDNGWPELFYAVEGGDVFALELIDTSQPQAQANYLTEITYFATPSRDTNIDLQVYDNLLLHLNNDTNLDVLIVDNSAGGGLIAWDLETNTELWNFSDPFVDGRTEAVYSFDNIIVGISTKGIYAINNDTHTLAYSSINGTTNTLSTIHTLADVNNDSISDLIVAYDNNSDTILRGVTAINTSNGELIWQVVPDNQSVNPTYYDLITGFDSDGELVIVVSSSDFSSYKQIHVLNSTGTLLKSFDSDYTPDPSTRSVLGDFDGDLILDIASASFNADTGQSSLVVNDLNSFNTILDLDLPVYDGLVYSQLPIFSNDVNNDTRPDIILALARYRDKKEEASFFPRIRENLGLLVAIDVETPVIIWERAFPDSISQFERVIKDEEELFIISTEYEGVFGITPQGADAFWAKGGFQPITTNLNSQNNQELIAVTAIDGKTFVSQFSDEVTRAVNYVTPRNFIVKTTTTLMYDLDLLSFTIPIDVYNRGAEELLTGFSNGTLTLQDFRRGELWRINITSFTSLTAASLEFYPNRFGFVWKTDSSNLTIFERTATEAIVNITTPGILIGDIIAFNLQGGSDYILIQTKTDYGTMLSLLNPVTEEYFWNKTFPTEFKYINVGNFNYENINETTHIIALDHYGTASLIELPTTFLPGGNFPEPSEGYWVSAGAISIEQGLTDVYLSSNFGEVRRFRWPESGGFITDTYTDAPGKLLISEVLYQQLFNITDEWIEIFNPSSKEISLTGYKLVTKRANMVYSLSGTIGPKETRIIMINSTPYSLRNFTNTYGIRPDFIWYPNVYILYNTGGDAITLLNPEDKISDYVAWENGMTGWTIGFGDFVDGFSLKRKSTVDTDTENDWDDATTAGIPGEGLRESILITEVMYDPPGTNLEGAEWIELYNPTDYAIVLDGWYIVDSTFTRFILSGTIPAKGYLVIARDRDQFKQLYGFEPDLHWKDDANFVLDLSDYATIANPEGVSIDTVAWNWGGWNTVALGSTVLRESNIDTGVWTDFIDSGTLGDPRNGNYHETILISEVYYDPRNGRDSDNEWIELYNPTSRQVSLNDWRLKWNTTRNGLKVEAYDDTGVAKFTGPLLTEWITNVVDFYNVDPMGQASYYTIRITGYIVPLYSETYTFYLATDDGARMWVDGNLLINKWYPQATTTHAASMNLIAGQRYPITIEHFENGGVERLRLAWASPSQSWQVVPKSSLLYPVTESDPINGIIPAGGNFVIARDSNKFTSLYGFEPDYELGSETGELSGVGGLYLLNQYSELVPNDVGLVDTIDFDNWKLYAIDQTIERVNAIDQGIATDFRLTGSLGNPGYGSYPAAYQMLQVIYEDSITNDLLLSTSSNELKIIRDDNGTLSLFTSLPDMQYTGTYIPTIFANLDGDEQEIIIALGNMILVLAPDGTPLEIHSTLSEVIKVIPWSIDQTDRQSLVITTANDNIYVVDTVGRKLGCLIDNVYCNPHPPIMKEFLVDDFDYTLVKTANQQEILPTTSVIGYILWITPFALLVTNTILINYVRKRRSESI